VPTVEGLQFTYAIHPLPPGRVPFRRWRWELWHGSSLAAAGWRLSEREAGRAVRAQARAFAHRLFGLPAPRPEPARGELPPGSVQRMVAGPITCLLIPRALAEVSGVSAAAPAS
jgi:hypothetical protein